MFEPLGCCNTAFEPVLAVLAMKANIDLVAGSIDSNGKIESSGASIEV
jgi:hypothetical protein